jgi:G:T-mismatch repair DNA endonuclease (very short patch repair protein)
MKAEALSEQGWRVLTIWECETKDSEDLSRKLSRHLKEIASASGGG